MARIIIKVPVGPSNIRAGLYLPLLFLPLTVCSCLVMEAAHRRPYPTGRPDAPDLLSALLIAAAFLGVFIVLFVLPLELLWFRHITRGRAVPIILGYAAYLPAYLLAGIMGLFVAAPVITTFGGGSNGLSPVVAVVFILAVLLTVVALIVFFVLNILSPGLSHWIGLDGYCPICRKWRFRRGKPGTTEQCAECGADLAFEWAE